MMIVTHNTLIIKEIRRNQRYVVGGPVIAGPAKDQGKQVDRCKYALLYG